MNQVNTVGRLGADVDFRYRTASQKAVARMSIAVSNRYGETERACPPSAISSRGAGGLLVFGDLLERTAREQGAKSMQRQIPL